MNKMGLLFSLVIGLYIFCWLTDQPTKALWYIGVALPWLSVFAAIPISILTDIEEKDNWKIWCYLYALATLLYIIVVPSVGGRILNVLPHLGCCIFAILAVACFMRKAGQ